MSKIGLVLQGGGALGAYEYGAVTRLVEFRWQPVAVTGVSIGAKMPLPLPVPETETFPRA
jgi:NTE family protein